MNNLIGLTAALLLSATALADPGHGRYRTLPLSIWTTHGFVAAPAAYSSYGPWAEDFGFVPNCSYFFPVHWSWHAANGVAYPSTHCE